MSSEQAGVAYIAHSSKPVEIDERLVRIVEGWHSLPDCVKVGMLAMVEASRDDQS